MQNNNILPTTQTSEDSSKEFCSISVDQCAKGFYYEILKYFDTDFICKKCNKNIGTVSIVDLFKHMSECIENKEVLSENPSLNNFQQEQQQIDYQFAEQTIAIQPQIDPIQKLKDVEQIFQKKCNNLVTKLELDGIQAESFLNGLFTKEDCETISKKQKKSIKKKIQELGLTDNIKDIKQSYNDINNQKVHLMFEQEKQIKLEELRSISKGMQELHRLNQEVCKNQQLCNQSFNLYCQKEVKESEILDSIIFEKVDGYFQFIDYDI